MDVNLDEMAEEISQRIENLKIKKIRIQERLKAIETKSENLTNDWLGQLEAIEAVKLLAAHLATRNREIQSPPEEVSQVAAVQAEELGGQSGDSSACLEEFPHQVESYVDSLPEINSFKIQADTRTGHETYGSDSLGSLKEQLAAENPGESRESNSDENLNLRV